MKRFILYSLSATAALTLGTVARADMHQDMMEEDAPTEGVISPDDMSPDNRVVPGQGAVEAEGGMQDSEEMDTTEGIISPDDSSPNNRETPDAGPVDGGAMESPEGDNTRGIISPDDSSPNNRAIPGGETAESDMLTFEEAFELFRETGEVMPYERTPSPTGGIISPDSQSPNNRAVPDRGPTGSDAMDASENVGTDGIISPDDMSPNNRAQPSGATGTMDQDMMDSSEDTTDGIISPDDMSPNNRETPGM
jgi:hypothetical protein